MFRFLCLVIGMIIWSTTCFAVTWSVDLEGNGDFTVIQDAVDAAAPGDTILLGPGRFETIRPVPFWEGYSSTICVMKGGLVIEGAAPGRTIIGTGSTDWYYRPVIGNDDPSVYSFTLRNLTVLGGYNGLHYEGDGLQVYQCDFEDSIFGAVTFGTAGCSLINCNFSGVVNAFSSYGLNSDVEINNCRVDGGERGFLIQNTSNANVSNCVVSQALLGIQFQTTEGSVNNCQVTGVDGADYGSGVVLIQGCVVEMNGCDINLSNSNTESALAIISGSSVFGTGNRIEGGGHASILTNGAGIIQGFFNNEIIKANNFCLVAKSFDDNFNNPNLLMDLSNNNWGTEVDSLISEWIDDANDHPNDPNYRTVVQYQPIFEDPVPTEKTTLDGLKALYR